MEERITITGKEVTIEIVPSALKHGKTKVYLERYSLR
jgi:hypothetical protein